MLSTGYEHSLSGRKRTKSEAPILTPIPCGPNGERLNTKTKTKAEGECTFVYVQIMTDSVARAMA
jgi:hypothetical protein